MQFTRADYKKGLITGILTVAGMFILIAAVDNFDQIKAKTANFVNCLYASHIYEQDADAGVTIDGLTIKDGVITSASPITGYIEDVNPAVAGNIAGLTVAGKVYDTGVYIGDIGGGGGVIYEATIGTAGSGADYECDGTADEVEFAAAVAALSDGDDIRVLPGTYKFADTLTVDKAINIDGGDRTATVIQIDGNFRGIVATASIALQHLTLTATANQTDDDWPSEYVCPLIELKANGCIIHGNYFAGGLGVYAHYGYHRITENTFNNYSGASGVGLAISYSDSMAVAPREGYIGIQPKYNVVERNIFGYGAYIKRGIYIENQVQTTSISNNFFKAYVGIESDSTFDYSAIKGNSLYCVTALIDLADSDNTVISGNVQEGSDPTDGIIIGGSNNSITSNVFNNVTTDYIRIITGSSKNIVSSNRALGSAPPSGGITEAGTADYTVLAANANMGTATLVGAHSENRDTAGSGDVTGPSGGTTATMLAGYADATGKVLQATACYSDQVVNIASPDVNGLPYYSGAETGWLTLAAGDNDKVLTMVAGVPAWADASGGLAPPSPMVEGNIVAATTAGVLYDSGYKPGDFQSLATPTLHGNIALLTSAGQVYDSGVYIGDVGGGGSGDVVGPSGGTTATMLAGFADTTGKALQATAVYSNEVVNIASPDINGLPYYSGAETGWLTLAIGDEGDVLTVSSGIPAWEANTSQQLAIPSVAGNIARLNIAGQVYDSGVMLEDYISISSPANGDILYYNSGWQTLAKGDDGQYLKLASGVPSWAAAGSATIDDTAWTGANWTSTTNGISADKLEGALDQVITGWYEGGSFTRTDDDTFSVTDSAANVEAFKVGRPVRYADTKGTWSYGIVTTQTDAGATLTIDIAGAPMTTSFDAYIQYGDMSKAIQFDLYLPGDYGASTGDKLASVGKAPAKWRTGKAYLVQFHGSQHTAYGTTQPKVNVKVNGSAVSTADSNNGIQLSTADTWVDNATTSINTSNYDINKGEALEINVTGAGVGTAGGDLVIECVFVQE